jgi:hypothetical protein
MAMLGVSRGTVERAIADGRLRSSKKLGVRLIAAESLKALFDETAQPKGGDGRGNVAAWSILSPPCPRASRRPFRPSSAHVSPPKSTPLYWPNIGQANQEVQ